MVIRRIGVASLAKMMGALYGLMGLIFGCFFALISLVGAGLAQGRSDEPAWLGAIFGVGAVIFLPILYGVLGFVFGALTAWLYNVVAGIAGGVEVETQ
jgi:hypothetical protein